MDSRKNNNNPLVSIVVPFLNEEEAIPRLVNEICRDLAAQSVVFELILVDDGSSDRSVYVAKSEVAKWSGLNARIIVLSRNFGKEAAMTAGLKAARGDVIVPLDADLQDPPRLIGAMLDYWRQGYDVVYGVRRRREGEGKLKRLTAFSFYRLMGRLSNTEIPADTGDFRLMDRRVVNALLRLDERSRFMKGLFAWVGFRQVAFYYDRESRKEGKTNWNYWKLWNFAIDGVTSFSKVPLQVWSYAGLAIALLAMGYGSWMVIRTLVYGIDLPGYASIMTVVLVLGGVQLIGLGVLGEYLGRIFEEVKARPLYIVREEWQSNDNES